MSSSAKQFLQLTEVREVIASQELVSVTTDSPVSEAMAKLIAHRIQSVPVFDSAQKRFSTFVDTVDIATHAIKVLEKFEDNGQLVDIDGAKSAFGSAKCSDIANISRGNPYFQVLSTDSVKVCINRMVALVNIHRLPVLTLSGEFIGVLTQSQIISLIAKNIDLFSFANKTVEELRLGYDFVVSIHKNKSMKEAFQLISEHRTAGIAVVDNDDVIFGNVSASDIKLIGQSGEKIQRLYSKVVEVLDETQAKVRPVCVGRETTFKELVKKIVAERVHRVFVVNESDQLIGVVRLVTILDFVQNYV
jgi:CBS-domain-containing membrane protein